MIRDVTLDDAARLADIYNHYIQNTIITFEEEILTAAQMGERIEKLAKHQLPWIVIEQEGVVAGYAYAGQFRERSAYRFASELSVYLAPDATGAGMGTRLFSELFKLLEATPIHVIIGGIALPNEASIALHEKFGMEKVAEFQQVGFKFGRWIDVGYWQKVIK